MVLLIITLHSYNKYLWAGSNIGQVAQKVEVLQTSQLSRSPEVKRERNQSRVFDSRCDAASRIHFSLSHWALTGGRGRGRGLWQPFHTGSYKQKLDSLSKDTSRMLAWCWIQSWKRVELMEATAVSLGTVHMTCSTQPFTRSGPLYNTSMASPAYWRRWGTLQGRPWSTAIFGSAGSIPLLVSPSRMDYYFSLDKRR